MVKNYKKLNEIRINRISKIKDKIYNSTIKGEKGSYKKIIAEFCISEGLSKRTVKEYVDLLIDSGQIIKEGDKLM